MSAVFNSVVLTLSVTAWSVSGSRSERAYAVVGCSDAVSKFCPSVLVAKVDSLAAIFSVLLATVVSILLATAVESIKN